MNTVIKGGVQYNIEQTQGKLTLLQNLNTKEYLITYDFEFIYSTYVMFKELFIGLTYVNAIQRLVS